MEPWEQKAHKIIAAEAMAQYRAANNGRRKYRPYSLPQWVRDLVVTLGMEDRTKAEEKAKAMFLRHINGQLDRWA